MLPFRNPTLCGTLLLQPSSIQQDISDLHSQALYQLISTTNAFTNSSSLPLCLPFAILFVMIEGQQDTEGLEELSLLELLGRQDLCLQQVLSVQGVQGKIRDDVQFFMEHCRKNDSFADRLITLGLKCPMHMSASPHMRALTFIAAELLTSDHEAIADFLLPSNEPHAVVEHIETEEDETTPSESERYKWLSKLMEYLLGEELEENCVNYIAKSLQVLVRKRLGALLEYLRVCPDVLARLAHLAHFPSIAHLLAKLIVTEEEEPMPPAAREARRMVVPLLLQKLHNDLALPSAVEVVDCLQEILQPSRYSQQQEARSELQQLSDIIVSAEEVGFHLEALLRQPTPHAAFNSVSYLVMVVARMNLDQQEGPSFKPTLFYQLDPLFEAFARLSAATARLGEADKLLGVRWLELLVGLGRHSRFGEFYSRLGREERIQGLRALVWGVARGKFTGVLLQLVCNLVEMVVLQQQRIAHSDADSAVKLSPNAVYALLSDHQLHLHKIVQALAKEGPRERNRNSQGVFLRKLLMVLDNFFKNSEIHRHFPEVEAVTNLFPTFTPDACRQYTQNASINSHPAGNRAKAPLQFGFIRRNQEYHITPPEDQQLENLPSKLPSSEPNKQAIIMLKFTQKITTQKERVRAKQNVKVPEQGKSKKEEEEREVKPTEDKEQSNSNYPAQWKAEQERQEENRDQKEGGRKERLAQLWLTFFVRHLLIY